MAPYSGILLCEKSYGISSHKTINQLRQIMGQKKIGHTGTLDPRATGLLVLCLGRATKIAQFLSDFDKSYDATVRLGQSSPTYDSEGISPDDKPQPVPDLSENDINEILDKFRGRIKQKVPPFSAVKVNGEKLYKLARRGENVELPEKDIEIKNIELVGIKLPEINLRIDCSKGTYIRTLAHDIGREIGCGAYLSALVRTRIGPYKLEDALSVNQIKHYRDAGKLKGQIRPIESVLQFPWLKVHEEFSPHILTGRPPRLKDISEMGGSFEVDELISLKDHNDMIVAVGRAGIDSGQLNEEDNRDFFKYVRVLN